MVTVMIPLMTVVMAITMMMMVTFCSKGRYWDMMGCRNKVEIGLSNCINAVSLILIIVLSYARECTGSCEIRIIWSNGHHV